MLPRLLILLGLLLMSTPAAAQLAPRPNAIQPQLVAEGPAPPGREVELAINMRTSPGWHGYWLNPGDAGLPMEVDWQLPPGFSAGPLRYPVPTRMTIAGLMNYVYERDYALLVRLTVPAGAKGTVPIRAEARWLACTDKICVPEQGGFALDLPVGGGTPERARFDEWRRALPRPLAGIGRFALARDRLLMAIPLPAGVKVEQPYLYPQTDGVVDYAGDQRFRRSGDTLVADLPLKPGVKAPASFAAVLAIGDGSGLELKASPGAVPEGGTALGNIGARTLLLTVLGLVLGGILLNLMPCVFPILALKAAHLSRAGGEAREARSDALAYALGAVIGTGALGALLLALRAGGSAAGWAFQLQDPRTVLMLLLLAAAITLNLLGVFQLPALGGSARPRGGFATGALAAFVATPCSGPFLGTALGAALALPAAWSVPVFGTLGLGLALPFVIVAFVPALRRRLPKPGPWMERFQRFLAIPMAASAVAALWLLYRQGGREALLAGIAGVAAVVVLAIGYRFAQRSGRRLGVAILIAVVLGSAALLQLLPARSSNAGQPVAGADQWSEARVARLVGEGRPVFVYFTADWCLTCKANEAAAIDHDETRRAFRKAGVKVLAGDWTNGDPAITRFLESRGRAGVPLYLWYEPGRGEPEELPQVLTPGMLVSRAQRSRT